LAKPAKLQLLTSNFQNISVYPAVDVLTAEMMQTMTASDHFEKKHIFASCRTCYSVTYRI